jgi:bifunctional DNA primase/polymerase-like protein
MDTTIQIDGDASAKSAYARTAPALIASGYSAIPIVPGEKCPGVARPMRNWNKFCAELPSDAQVAAWSRCSKDLGVGVALGAASGGLVAVDVDSDDPAVAVAVDRVSGVSPVRKRGRRGFTAFFRASAAVKSRPFKFANGDGVDLLAHGRQTVLPPTIHPSGEPYVWLGVDTLEHVSPEHLPELPDDIADQLADALAPFGYVAEPERPAVAHTDSGGDTIWAETKAAALANLEAWVPALDIGAKREGAGWRARALWRNGEGFNVSFHPKGIRDFAGDVGYSAVDIVMKVQGCADHAALTWLRDKLGLRDPEPIEFRLKMKGDAASFDGKPEALSDMIRERVGDMIRERVVFSEGGDVRTIYSVEVARGTEVARANFGADVWAKHGDEIIEHGVESLSVAHACGIVYDPLAQFLDGADIFVSFEVENLGRFAGRFAPLYGRERAGSIGVPYSSGEWGLREREQDARAERVRIDALLLEALLWRLRAPEVEADAPAGETDAPEADADAPQQRRRGGKKYGEFYAYLPMHQYIYKPTRDMWPASSVDASFAKGQGWCKQSNRRGRQDKSKQLVGSKPVG